MNIRFANINDYENIKDLLKENFGFKILKDDFDKYLEKNNILVVVKNNIAIACAIYEIINDCFANKKILFLRYLCVKLEFQNKGIGKMIINKIKQIASDLNANAIELTCADFRKNSHQFYLKNDFSIKKTKVFICETFKNEPMGGGRANFYPKVA